MEDREQSIPEDEGLENEILDDEYFRIDPAEDVIPEVEILEDETAEEETPEEEETAEEEDKKLKRRKTVLSYLHDLVFGLVAVLLVFMLVFRVIVVSGPSMMQTLQNGDCIILLSSVFYGQPKQGDIVVVSKESYDNGKPIIKRVIATEGQIVDIDFVSGQVKVDDIVLDEPYINTPTNRYEGVEFPLTVEKGCVFVLGDNRDNSKDSRSPDIGQIDCREILGKALFLVLPGADPVTGKRDFNRIGVLW